MCPGRGLRRKGNTWQTLTLGSELVKPQTEHPSPGIPCRGGKLPELIREPLGQIG